MKKALIFGAIISMLVPAIAMAQSTGQGVVNVYVQVINPNSVSYSPSNFTVNVLGGNPSPSSFQGSLSGTLVSVAAGTYSVTVANQYGFTPSYSVGCNSSVYSGQTQLCVITMSGSVYNPVTTVYPWTAAPAPLTCRSDTPTVALGQTARFSAIGGAGGTYNWMTATRNFPNIGPVLTSTFSVSGTQTVSVTNAGQTAICTVTVLTTYAPVPATPGYVSYPNSVYTSYPNAAYTATYSTAPSFPNTGFAPSNGAEAAFAVVLLSGAAMMTYPYARKAFAVAVR